MLVMAIQCIITVMVMSTVHDDGDDDDDGGDDDGNGGDDDNDDGDQDVGDAA